MHKYQPRVHIIRKKDHTASVINLKSERMKTFTFRETSFIAVTAYQNQLVSHLLRELLIISKNCIIFRMLHDIGTWGVSMENAIAIVT